jgi:predicted NUDIX family NTP pyrophosphohydrolase
MGRGERQRQEHAWRFVDGGLISLQNPLPRLTLNPRNTRNRSANAALLPDRKPAKFRLIESEQREPLKRRAEKQGARMPKRSAGLLTYRESAGNLEVFLVHPGGPFSEKRDMAVWSIPKGEYKRGDDPFEAALREYEEETGFKAAGDFFPLGEVRQSKAKIVTAWALKGNCDPERLRSNLFSMEWPKGSGIRVRFPEVDRGAWYTIDVARQKILQGQAGFLDLLESKLALMR